MRFLLWFILCVCHADALQIAPAALELLCPAQRRRCDVRPDPLKAVP